MGRQYDQSVSHDEQIVELASPDHSLNLGKL